MIVSVSSQTLEKIIDNEIRALILLTALISLGVFVQEIIGLVKHFCAPKNKISEEKADNKEVELREDIGERSDSKNRGETNIFCGKVCTTIFDLMKSSEKV